MTTAARRSQSSHERMFVFLGSVVSNLVPLAEDTFIANVGLQVVIVDVIVTLEHGHLDRSRHWRGEFVTDHEKTRQRLIFHYRTCSRGANRLSRYSIAADLYEFNCLVNWGDSRFDGRYFGFYYVENDIVSFLYLVGTKVHKIP